MLKLVLAGAVAIPAAATATVAATGVAWVDVQEGGRDGHRLVIPIPLLIAETAVAFVPKHELRVPPEAIRHLPVAREVLQALAESPDAEFVRVEEKDEQVSVSKAGDLLHVLVHGRDGEEVSVNVPLSAVRDLLHEDGTFDPADAVRLIRLSRFTNLVEVRQGDEHVKITVW
jgi:hypothetical protein